MLRNAFLIRISLKRALCFMASNDDNRLHERKAVNIPIYCFKTDLITAIVADI